MKRIMFFICFGMLGGPALAQSADQYQNAGDSAPGYGVVSGYGNDSTGSVAGYGATTGYTGAGAGLGVSDPSYSPHRYRAQRDTNAPLASTSVMNAYSAQTAVQDAGVRYDPH